MDVSATARKFKVTRKFVQTWGRRYLKGESNAFKDKTRSGRPRKLTTEGIQDILACVDDKANGIRCARHICNATKLRVSVRTVKRVLQREKCHYAGATKKRRLTAAHKSKRLAFARKYHDHSPFKQTAFSDSSYVYNGRPAKQWVREGEENEVIYDKHPMKLHIYGMIWHGGRSDLYFATGTTKQAPYATGTKKKARGCTGKEYREKVLAEYFLPRIKERIIAGGDGSFYFMQDGAKIHTAKLTKDMLKEWIGKNWLDVKEV